MRAVVPSCLVCLVAALWLPSAGADLVMLRNGGELCGKITRETADEIDLTLADGMRLTIRRSRIRTIERREEAEPASVPEDPRRAPLRPPEQKPDTPPAPKPDTPPRTAIPLLAGPFESSPFTAWNGDYSRYPVLMAAKNTAFRAYRLTRRTPLAVDPGDPRYAELLRQHGQGGGLSVWEFEYAGMGELRYGDEVRFISEISSPTDPENQLIRLKEGPTTVTSRLAVFLVKRRGEIERFATTTVFAPPDFRQEDLRRLSEFQMNVRTWQDDYVPVASNWLEQSRSEFLAGIDSPLGNSIRMRLQKIRFRLEWYETPPEDRPALDPDLITRDYVRPVAKPGRPVAGEELIRRAWGTARSMEVEYNLLVEELRTNLLALGIKSGGNYIIEYERIGILDAKGVSIETRRQFLAEKLLEELLTPR